MKPALIVIGMNKEFVYGRLGNERARNLVPRLRKLIESARESGVPIIYVCDAPNSRILRSGFGVSTR